MPFPSGNRTSKTATSGRSAGIRASACATEPGLAHDFEFGIDVQEVDQSTPDDFVVIHEKDFHHLKPSPWGAAED